MVFQWAFYINRIGIAYLKIVYLYVLQKCCVYRQSKKCPFTPLTLKLNIVLKQPLVKRMDSDGREESGLDVFTGSTWLPWLLMVLLSVLGWLVGPNTMSFWSGVRNGTNII